MNEPRGDASVDYINRIHDYSISSYILDMKHEQYIREQTIRRHSSTEQITEYMRLKEAYALAKDEFEHYEEYLFNRATSIDAVLTPERYIRSFDNL